MAQHHIVWKGWSPDSSSYSDPKANVLSRILTLRFPLPLAHNKLALCPIINRCWHIQSILMKGWGFSSPQSGLRKCSLGCELMREGLGPHSASWSLDVGRAQAAWGGRPRSPLTIWPWVYYLMWTVNFLMFKLVLEKAEEPEIKLPTSAGSWQKQESSRKASISALLTMPKPLTVWITRNCGNFFKRWEYQTTWSASWEICMQVRKQQLELDMEQ